MSRPVISNEGRIHISKPVPANALGHNIVLEGIAFPKTSSKKLASIFDGNHLWIAPSLQDNNDLIVKYDTLYDNTTYYPCANGENGNSGLERYTFQQTAVFVDDAIWYMPYGSSSSVKATTTAKQLINTGTITGIPNQNLFADWNDSLCYCIKGARVDNRIWMTTATEQYLCYFDITTHTMHKVQPTLDLPLSQISYDGEFLWLVPKEKADYFYRVNTHTLECTMYSCPKSSEDSYFNFNCIVHNTIWAVMQPRNSQAYILKFDISTKSFQSFELVDNVNCNSNMGNSSATYPAFLGITYDGRNLWLSPAQADRLVRLNPQNGSMTGYNLEGINLGNVNSVSENKFADINYDGHNLWLIPSSADRLVKVSSTDHPWCIEEQYLDEQGNEVSPTTYSWVDDGDPYTKTATAIENYTCIGHRINGGELNPSATASIPGVTADHTVVFVYRKDTGGGGDGCCCCGCSITININCGGCGCKPKVCLQPGRDSERPIPGGSAC